MFGVLVNRCDDDVKPIHFSECVIYFLAIAYLYSNVIDDFVFGNCKLVEFYT